MSEQLKWGNLFVYLYDDFARVYSFVGHGPSTCVEYRLNSDNSLAEKNTKEHLLPVEYWHEMRKHEHKIITYLMLRRCK